MDKLLLLIMAASELSAVSSAAGLQYYFVYDRKNFTEAQRYCREKHTDLVTVDSMEVMNNLTNMADLDNMVYSNNSYRAWIGLSGDSWRWSLSDTSFYKPGETEFRRWYPGQPNAGYSGKACTVMFSYNGLWYIHGCNVGRYPICTDVRGSDVTFVSIYTPMNWTAAQSYCRAHHTDLASVRNMADNQKLQKVIAGGYYSWIGLFRDPWKWSDGSTSSFSFWKNGQPVNNGNETCVAADFSQSGAWEVWPCDMERAFICYGPGEC
ncbi:secretory phospholipase A2 receptor-like [Perca flavescens]|uniref:secretory phospholipase A2 receptor-like n=1 Tax=Perca flavescens TaxID=8167 RepID=UPI00106F0950|nr:secretory phospholipase A2 receptor-like [Perca flavescens]